MAGTIEQIETTGSNSQLCGLAYQLTADGSGVFGTLEIKGNVWIAGIEVVFDAVTPPNAITFPLNTVNDVSRVDDVSVTASGVVGLEFNLIPFPFGVKIPFTGNTTPNAKAKVIFSVMRG